MNFDVSFCNSCSGKMITEGCANVITCTKIERESRPCGNKVCRFCEFWGAGNLQIWSTAQRRFPMLC